MVTCSIFCPQETSFYLLFAVSHMFLGADLVEIYSHLSLNGALTGEPLKLLSSQSAYGTLFGLSLHHILLFFFTRK